MKRPILIGTLALVHGELTVMLLSNKVSVIFIMAVIFVAIVTVYCIVKRRLTFIVLYTVAFLIGCLCTVNVIKEQEYVEEIREGQKLSLSGEVLKVQENDYGVEVIVGTETFSVGKIKCIVVFDSKVEIRTGNMVEIGGIKKEFQIDRNPGSFNEREYYYGINIILKCEGISYRVVDERINEFQGFTDYIKEQFGNMLSERCPRKEAGIFKAMVYGDKSSLDNNVKELYSNGGISHILAVSGLHISIMGMGAYKILRRLLPPKWSGVLSTLFMILYGIITGGTVSSVRAIIMFLVNLLSKLSGNAYDIKNAVCVAAICLLVKNPFYITNSSFQMSFGAMVAIGFVLPELNKFLDIKNKFLQMVTASIVVSIINGPIIANTYYEISSYGVILNLVVIPLMSLVVFSGVAGIVGGAFFIGCGYYVLKLYEAVCIAVTKLPFTKLVTGSFSMGQLLIYYGGIGLLMVYVYCVNCGIINGLKIRKAATSIGVALIFNIFLFLTNPEKNIITFLDVGQGDSSVYVSPEGVVFLFDCGSSNVKNVGKYRILTFLKNQGIKKVDYIVLSHSDGDHINGVMDLIEDGAIKVENIVFPVGDDGFGEIRQAAVENSVKIIDGQEGLAVKGEGFKVSFISPSLEYNDLSDVNENSLVAIISTGKWKIGMMGDIGFETEEKIVRDNVADNLDILKVAHHGSKYSTGVEFLEYTQPDIGIISCSSTNTYGHPSQDTLERLGTCGSGVWCTKDGGAIKVLMDGDKIQVEEYCPNEVAGKK